MAIRAGTRRSNAKRSGCCGCDRYRCLWKIIGRVEPKCPFGRWRDCVAVGTSGTIMDINPQLLSPLVALVAGILILLVPRLLNYIVAIYLIIIGVAGLMGRF